MAFQDIFYGAATNDWQTLAILAAVGSILVSILLIMFSRLFDLRNLEQTAKAEFVFAASTVFIVLFTVGLISFAEGVPGSPGVILKIAGDMYKSTVTYCPDPNSPSCQAVASYADTYVNSATLIDLSTLYMEPPAKCSQQFLNFLYYAAIPIDACSSLYMEIYMCEQMTCFGLKWASERITNTVQMLTFYMFAYYLLFHTFTFIKYYAGFFFSIGVVLRAFPPTRGGGAYLMAIAVGLYFVFPFTYILITTMSLPHAQSNMLSATGVDTSSGGSSLLYSCGMPSLSSLRGMDCGTGSIAKPFQLMLWLGSNKNNIQDFFDFSIPELTRHLISVVCIFPLVAFAVVISFVLNTTNLFGGNIPEIGRGLVRLI
jgi:hypothetical protein